MYHVHAKRDGKMQCVEVYRRKADAIAACNAEPERSVVTKAYDAQHVHNNGIDQCWSDTVANSLAKHYGLDR